MASHLSTVFATCAAQGRPAFVTYVTAGFPTVDAFPAVLLGLQRGGADIIEVGVPFTDPMADGATIQGANQIALNNGFDSVAKCLDLVKKARSVGVSVPIVFMGYSNPFIKHGETELMRDCVAAGVDGFIIVDLPPEESQHFRAACSAYGLSFIPLIAPTTTDSRIAKLAATADSFIYCVSLTGTTGARTAVSADLPEFLKRIKKHTKLPLAVGFGISSREHFHNVGRLAEGVVIGSAVITRLESLAAASTAPDALADGIAQWAAEVSGRSLGDVPSHARAASAAASLQGLATAPADGEAANRFGNFGGRFVSETLVAALEELETVFKEAMADPKFHEELRSYYSYVGRPTPLHLADRLTADAGGARIWLKREDLNHTGAHKINNAIGQALLAKRLGKTRIIAETGAGQHGVASATVCAKLGLELVVYMGAEDVRRQALNVFRMEMLGAKVVPVHSGSKTLKDAINEAMRDWVTNIQTTHYLIGSAIGPHPFPTIVREFQSVIGRESRKQMLEIAGKLPDAIVACVGGGSNSIGMFHPFIEDASVQLWGAEAGGDGVDTPRHSATLCAGTPGVLHGTRTYLLQDGKGQIQETHSISAGLDYPGVGPEHAWLKDTNRASYVAVTDRESLIGFKKLTQLEGIIPALESSHAVYFGLELAKKLGPGKDVLICVSGRGDKDIDSVRAALPKFGCKLRMRTNEDVGNTTAPSNGH
eukprot:Opistho-2@75636